MDLVVGIACMPGYFYRAACVYSSSSSLNWSFGPGLLCTNIPLYPVMGSDPCFCLLSVGALVSLGLLYTPSGTPQTPPATPWSLYAVAGGWQTCG
jgi:hypothetical protein